MGDTILVRGARQLLTLRGAQGPRRGTALREIGIIPDGALLIRDGVITDVGPGRRIESLAAARTAREINADGRVVMPGFVDSRARLAFGHFEPDGENSGQSDLNAIRTLSARRLAWRARGLLRTFLRHGTTTLEARTGYAQDAAVEMKSLRVLAALREDPLDIVATYLPATGTPSESGGDADGYVEWMCSSLMPRLRKQKLARFVGVCAEESEPSQRQAHRCFSAARELGFPLKVHAGGVRLALEFDAVSMDYTSQTTASQSVMLARSATIACLLPGLTIPDGIPPPARELIDAGAAVALATGFHPCSNATCSMPMMISLACMKMGMTPAEAITASTINGAWATRSSERVGSLEYGKQADVIVLDVRDYREIPHHFGVNPVVLAIKRGKVVYDAEGNWNGN
ncbi:MAG: amidohydrolase family protein [Bryobacteraceae bacterium]